MAWDPALEVAFHPRTIAIVGASSTPPASDRQWGGGYMFIRHLQELGFPGHIYPVNPKATTIRGLQAYPSVASIPEPVDLVIVAVPSSIAPIVLEDCVKAGAKNIHMFTSGYGEVGDEEGRQRERDLLEIARRGGLRIIGPNCMGLHVPSARISTMDSALTEPGPVALVSQSGGHATYFIRYARGQRVRLSKVISFGNGLALESVDFLEYLGSDPETKVICMYIEGVRDGRGLLRLARQINPVKPIIVWKGGLTEAGAGAAASHTGSLAGARQVWQAFFRQTGAVQVNSVEEMVDCARLFLHMPPFRDNRVCVIGGGGGNSVAWADICNLQGLEVPPLAEETRRKLRRYVPPAGNGIRNPLDAAPLLNDVTALRHAMDIVAEDSSIDALILNHDFQMGRDHVDLEALQELADLLIDVNKRPGGKPVCTVMGNLFGDDARTVAPQIVAKLEAGGVPVFSTLPRAARALARFADYHRALLVIGTAQSN